MNTVKHWILSNGIDKNKMMLDKTLGIGNGTSYFQENNSQLTIKVPLKHHCGKLIIKMNTYE